MATPKLAPITASKVDPHEWLASELYDRFEAVLEQRNATLDPDETDGVHDMRVAIRRLRSLIADFGDICDVRTVKRVRKELKKVAARLGKVRDQDVYIKALTKLHKKVEDQPHAEAVTRLIDHSRELREEAFKKIAKPLSRTSLDDLADKFSDAVESAADQPGLSQAAELNTAARRAVFTRLHEMADLGTNLYDPTDEKGLHKFRIAVKRLRYCMEAFAPVLNPSLETLADDVSKLQSFLGDIHDCDVWTERLGRRLRKMEKKGKGSPADLRVLSMTLSALVKRRSKRYRKALALWSEWETDDLFQKIDAAVSKRDGELRAVPSASPTAQ